MRKMTRGLWCGASDCGTTKQEVADFVSKVTDAGFNLLLPEVKGGHGKLRWPSRRFPDNIEAPYDKFDLPAVLIEESKKRGLELHAWFIDFFEGESGQAFQQHPEWAMRNKDGDPTNCEQLRGERFTGLWMCPSQRPGYTDQWLVPAYQEFAELYDFDAVHHDYVRYPGDLAPDQYCFCDSCLQKLPEWAGYLPFPFPDEPFDHDLYDREYLEAHWEQSPRVLPTYWEKLNRSEKSRFLLEGSFFRYGRQDLDTFFYQFRKEQITAFVKDCYDAIQKARPGMKTSAAVFKNPIHSGRFIGQDWRTFIPMVDTMIPMDYRDHYPGTFENYLGLLGATIENQQQWSHGCERYLTGFAVWPLIRNDERESDRGSYLQQVIQMVTNKNADGCVIFCAGDLTRYGLWNEVEKAWLTS